MNSTRLNTFQDSSGLVTVGVFQRRAGTPQQHFFDFSVDVPEDMIAVGGGGKAQLLPIGALLTASYPNSNMSAWLVSSKDHIVTEPHRLTAYAIGLKIAGMSRDELINSIHISNQTSGVVQHPETSASIPSGFLLISGGFRVDWTGAGNLATASFPETNFTWMARSKDHHVASPADLRVWAIGLKEQLTVGKIKVAITSKGSGQAQHPSSIADVPPGFALTGGGAQVHWNGYGNLLWNLTPATETTNQWFEGASKDHIYSDPSTITSYALGIQIVRAARSPGIGGQLEDAGKNVARVTLAGPSDGKNIIVRQTNGLVDTIMYPKNVGCGNLTIRCLDSIGRVLNGTEVTLEPGKSICSYTSACGTYSIVFSGDGNDETDSNGETKRSKIEFDR